VNTTFEEEGFEEGCFTEELEWVSDEVAEEAVDSVMMMVEKEEGKRR
jgi:hypothetical protein